MREPAVPIAVAGMLDEAGFGSHEAALMARARRDTAAFAELYRMHHAVIATYIHRRVGDEHVTDDLVSETFINALRYLGTFRSRGLPFRAWLYRIASNRVNRWARRERSHAFRELDETLPAPDGAGLDEKLARERARAALLTLPPKFQAVLSLHYLEGLPVEDVATALGLRVGTVKSRLSRGRDQLRARLQTRRSML